MPRRNDINSILIIGAGPIIIGQACEFDYSGTQACQALREEGYRVILINSNPATIMTDKDIADATYLEPIEVNAVEQIIIKEKPDAILPTVGGQTALDMAMQLDKKGILKKYKIKFDLLADEELKVLKKYKVWGKNKAIHGQCYTPLPSGRMHHRLRAKKKGNFQSALGHFNRHSTLNRF